ncbi:MAG: hypothetical protein AB8C02_11120 [Halioglobus sp.]
MILLTGGLPGFGADQQLLRDAAYNAYGYYFTASSRRELEGAFRSVIANIDTPTYCD